MSPTHIQGIQGGVLAFAVSFVLLFILLRTRLRKLMLDLPNERSLHELPVPRIGGLAIIFGATAGLSLCGASLFEPPRIFVGAVALVLLSLLDDARSLPVLPRLSTHLAICTYVAVAFLEAPSWGVVMLITAAMTWMINLYNFMDGSDGLAGGMSGIGFSFMAIAAYSATDNLALFPWCAVLACSSFAFLCFNFAPARVFMGDCGSVPLGFFAAGLTLLGHSCGAWPLWFPILIFAPFIIDASCTLAKRICSGQRFWEAHREHYYQRLIRMGWSHKKTALTYYSLMVICGTVALFALKQSTQTLAILLALSSTLATFLLMSVDRKWRLFLAAAAPP